MITNSCPKKFSAAKLFFSFVLAIILTLGLSISFQSLLADWTAPKANPPVCAAGDPGCDEPLNVGTEGQGKEAGLVLNSGGISANGLALPSGNVVLLTGKVGIGTLIPDAALQVQPAALVEGVRIVTSNYSPFIIRNSTDSADLFRIDQDGNITGVGFTKTAYMGLTDTAYDGNLNLNPTKGYAAANGLCNAKYSASHICTTEEILYLARTGALPNEGKHGWIVNGPPGYTANSNDCNGWTDNVGSNYGSKWMFINDTGGKGAVMTCNMPLSFACCK